MESHARVVVIGGGVTGCSVLYHLAKKGWSDLVLCERTELTAGSTWHSAGHVILYTMNDCVSRLNQYSVDLYKRLEAETGQDPGFHVCGNIRIATHPDRLTEFQRYMGVAETTGVNAEIIGPEEIQKLWPMMDVSGIYAGVINRDDGYIAPADLTQALASGARQMGATIHRQTEVTAIDRNASGEWVITTDRGAITAEHVVSCTGNYTLRTMGMVGMSAQAIPVKHQYLVTEPIPELIERRRAGLPELPVFRDPEQSFYVRQEGAGLAMGCYEETGECVFADGVPCTFGQDLFPSELDKMLPYIERAAERVSLFNEVGIKDVINGPMPYTPDDLPTCGPAFGLPNFWLAEGNPFGITLAGGVGNEVANWIVEGEPSIDMWACDSRRYGDWATRPYCVVKTEEAYERTYLLPKPDEELPAGRPLKTTPIHDLLMERGAVFGEVYGWERAKHYGDVAAECRSVSEGVAMADISHDARYRVTGEGAADLLNGLLCTPLPERGGRMVAGYVLSGRNTIRSVWRILYEERGAYLITVPASAERYDLDLLQKAATGTSVHIENLTGRLAGLALRGPKAEALLATITSAQHGTAGLAPAVCIQTTDNNFEILIGSEFLRHVFLALEGAGARLFGTHAANSLRLEAAFPAWGSELTREFKSNEVGLVEGVGEKRLVCMTLSGTGELDALGREPIREKGGAIVGKTTSGGRGHITGASLAMGYLDSSVGENAPLEVKLLGDWFDVARFELISVQGRRPQ